MVTDTQSRFLRRLSIGDTSTIAGLLEGRERSVESMDHRMMHLVRVAALIAIGADTPAYQREVSAARSEGASTDDILDVLRWVAPTVGSTHLMSAAPRLALALGYDVDASLETLDA